MKITRCLLQPLLLFAGSLLICLPGSLAAPGGGGVGVGTGSSAGGAGHAGSSAPAAVGHSSGVGSGYRSSVGLRSGLGGVGAAGYQSRIGSGGSRLSANLAAGRGFSNQGLATARVSQPIARVNNAWTDPVEPSVAGNARVGNNLHPGTYGYASNRAGNGPQHGPNGGNGLRGNHRYYYNNFPYEIYYPFLYNNYGFGGYGGYGGYGDLGYGGATDFAGLTNDGSATELAAPDFASPPNNYYGYVNPAATPSAPQAAPAQPLPDAPTVGPQDPSSVEKTPGASPGPDSLVEAVQNELAKRGYFDGKPDAMYSNATKEAIRRFQTDQHLPATGRINEATLHALRLD